MMKSRCVLALAVALLSIAMHGQVTMKQRPGYQGSPSGNGTTADTPEERRGERDERSTWGRDTSKVEKSIPIGLFQWRIDERLGTVIDAENNDTVEHNFQNFNLTDGYTGQYTYLGNLGAPRYHRIYMERRETNDFLFLQPFDHFRSALQDFRFTNTLSPVTNLAYHKCGTNQTGEDRVRAYFASNINKVSGIGFKVDYMYGRGYYNSSANSQFGGTLFGYYRGDKYNMHAYVNANHMKMAENGGIENDLYITDPQSFQQSYGTRDIPVMLDQTWNRNNDQTYYLSHRYNAGYYREIEVPDSLKPHMPSDAELYSNLPDSMRNALRTDSVAKALVMDSLRQDWQSKQIPPREYVPVTSFIHTLQVRNLSHTHIAHDTPADYYTHRYYGDPAKVKDQTDALSIRNTLGVEMREGFNKWAKFGIALFATHEHRNYRLPVLKGDSVGTDRWRENDLSVGGQLSKYQGQMIHYLVDGEVCLAGTNVGDFHVVGNGDLNIPLGKKDTLQIAAEAFIKLKEPQFYYRHYHSQTAWWDHDLSKETRTRIAGTLSSKKTRTHLTVGIENITNYTHLAMQSTPLKTNPGLLSGDYSHAVAVRQWDGNIQVFSAKLRQDFKFGPVGWENEVAYQKSSEQDILPLPTVTLYSNLYLLFRIAKVLRVQIGGDIRYFTSYYALDYAPNVGQFAIQDTDQPHVKIGNYPIVNVYANMHIKRCRIYASVNHANAGSGRMFLAPHYSLNPLTIHFGVSWNFFN